MNLSLDAFLSDVEKRLKAATQGPWAVVSDSLHYAIAAGDNVPIGSYLRVVETNEWQQNGPRHSNAGGIERERDAEFIAHSPQDVAGLVAVVRAAIEAANRRAEGFDPLIDAGYNRAHGEILGAMDRAVPGSLVKGE
jgi:hypothetical protein